MSRLFGSKAELYTVVGPTTVPLAELDPPRGRLGRTLVQQVLNRRDASVAEPWAALMPRIRQSPTPEAARDRERSQVLSDVAAITGDTTADRRHAAAVTRQLVGLAEGIRIAGFLAPPGIASDDVVDTCTPPRSSARSTAPADPAAFRRRPTRDSPHNIG